MEQLGEDDWGKLCERDEGLCSEDMLMNLQMTKQCTA
jgi:hypothetical protein